MDRSARRGNVPGSGYNLEASLKENFIGGFVVVPADIKGPKYRMTDTAVA